MIHEEYNAWQSAWHKQTTAHEPTRLDEILTRLAGHERRYRRINRAKLAAVVSIFTAMGAQLTIFNPRSPSAFILTGLALVAVSTLSFCVPFWPSNFAWRNWIWARRRCRSSARPSTACRPRSAMSGVTCPSFWAS